ncbi:MAG: ABC transporter permease [Verrucomicrobia bacterium]|nr:ABC transporter permease [Verrucomicrobiota bacterium]
MKTSAAQGGARGAWITAGPALAWLLVFLGFPLLLIAAASGLTRGDYGDFGLPVTGENYARLAGWTELGFDPLYPRILARSVVMGAATTLLCLVLGTPLAFCIARLPGRWRSLVLTLVIVPFWTNLLIRTYGWQMLLAPGAPLSRAAAALGFIAPGDGLYPGWLAVGLGMVCDFLPFLVLPLYASVEKLDWTLAEAAADLGAPPVRVFWHAILPQIRPGLAAGAALVFLPATGQFVVPDLLGGARTLMLGNAIQQQFGASRDWPFGAAMACVTLALMMAAAGVRFWRDRSGVVEGGR